MRTSPRSLREDELARYTGRPVSFNLSQIDPDPQLWRRAVWRVDRRAVAQVAGRGSVSSCAEDRTPLEPPTCRFTSSAAERRDNLRPEVRQRSSSADDKLDELGNFVTRSWHKMFVAEPGQTMSYEPGAEHSVAAIAAPGAHARRSPMTR